jgi:hypothetical protein
MPKFMIPVNEKKKRQKKTAALIYGTIVLVVFVISILSGKSQRFSQIAMTVILINGIWFLWSSISNIRDLEKVRFAEINEDHIAWAVQKKMDTVIILEWKDIRWIKKENDNSITVYRDSSFDNNLSLVDFAENDKIEIVNLLQKYTSQKQIRLVNFSEPSLAIA